jgi:hypothetical protein
MQKEETKSGETLLGNKVNYNQKDSDQYVNLSYICPTQNNQYHDIHTKRRQRTSF